VKDILAMENVVTGFGHPLWKSTHSAERRNAPVVDLLLSSGAEIVGRTHMDELAWSLFGVNYHYGMPLNPSAPEGSLRIPGGSSSGSAVAVASKQADLGIGTDTGGSIRVPASYCGVCGIRPTHGAVSLEGACALAPSFDTLGWFARDMELLARVGDVLLPRTTTTRPQSKERRRKILVAADAFKLAEEETQHHIYSKVSPLVQAKGSLMEKMEEIEVDPYGSGFDRHFRAFRILQSGEVWSELGPWVREHDPVLGPGIKERFQFAAELKEEEIGEEKKVREEITEHLHDLLGDHGVLMLPSAPGPPPDVSVLPPEEVDQLRGSLLRLTSIAGLTGFPQVSIPIGALPGQGPVGLSLLGPPGSDLELLELCKELAEVIS